MIKPDEVVRIIITGKKRNSQLIIRSGCNTFETDFYESFNLLKKIESKKI